jgi:hypothetical protein
MEWMKQQIKRFYCDAAFNKIAGTLKVTSLIVFIGMSRVRLLTPRKKT